MIAETSGDETSGDETSGDERSVTRSLGQTMAYVVVNGVGGVASADLGNGAILLNVDLIENSRDTTRVLVLGLKLIRARGGVPGGWRKGKVSGKGRG